MSYREELSEIIEAKTPLYYMFVDINGEKIYRYFEDEEGNSFGATYSSGYDLPDKECPKCGNKLRKADKIREIIPRDIKEGEKV